MANYNIPIAKTLFNEGGYNRPYGASGETYRGIDRKFHPYWSGWQIIDAIKKTKVIRNEEILKNDTLNALVFTFYKDNFWVKSSAGFIDNQELAEFYFDFYFHKPAIAVPIANDVAISMAKVATNPYKLTSAVIDSMNANPAKSYTEMRRLRRLHYANQYRNTSVRYSLKNSLSLIKNRVDSFATTLNNALTKIKNNPTGGLVVAAAPLFFCLLGW